MDSPFPTSADRAADNPKMIEAKVFPNSQVTSTPFKIKSVFSLEESSLALKSMLGVSPVADQKQVESKRSATETRSLPINTNVSSTTIEFWFLLVCVGRKRHDR